MADPVTIFLALTEIGLPTAAAAWIASNVVTIALVVASVTVSNYQRRKAQRAARDAFNANLEDRLVMVASADGPRSVVLGRVRNVDGVLFKATRGTNSEFYTLILALAGHEIDAIEQIYFGDQLVTLDGSGYVQTAPWLIPSTVNGTASMTVTGGVGTVTLPYTPISGSVVVSIGGGSGGDQNILSYTVVGTQINVTASTIDGAAAVNYQYVSNHSYARVRGYLGSPTQDISAELVSDFPSLCTSSDKFRGIALLRVDLEYNTDAFPTGIPSISAVIRGAKCYDPRSALTVWSQNPSILARHWVHHTNGGNTSSMNDTKVIAAANVCDVDTSFVSPSGTTVMDTYQAGIVCKLDVDPTIVMNELVESMAGRWGWAGGSVQLVAGGYRAPVATITEDWVSDASEIVVTAGPPRSELVNAYRPTISNRDNAYVAEPTPPLIASTYVTADGQQLDAEITMAAVTSPLHAQHIAGILLRDARQSLTIKLPCNLLAWKLEMFDTVSVTLERFGWTNKLFEVMGWRFSLQGGVVLTLKEASAAVYNPDSGFSDLGDSDNSDLPLPWEVPTVGNLNVTSGTASLVDGSIITRTSVVWPAVADAGVLQSGHIEVQYREASVSVSGDWPSQVEAGNTTSATIAGLRAGRVYLFRVRAINAAGVRGNWSVQSGHLVTAVPAINWTNVVDRPLLFRVASRGVSDTQAPVLAGLYNGETNASLYGYARSYGMARINRTTGAVTFQAFYDVHGVTSEATRLAGDLNATGSGFIVVLWAFDEPQTNRMFGTLPAAMYRCGASQGVFGSPQFKSRSAYVLVGIGGCGEGQGFEAYSGSIDNDTNAWCDIAFQLKAGNLIVSGTSATPRTLADYSYTGDLNATDGATFGVNISGQASTGDIAANAATEVYAATHVSTKSWSSSE